MPDLIATIFHVSDMHLFVDATGKRRHDAEWAARLMVAGAKAVPIPLVRALLGGSMWHSDEALGALVAELPEQIVKEGQGQPEAPILVLQTGDVEALGSAADPKIEGHEAFPSFGFVHRELRSRIVDAGGDWIDIFGNHDTWPGAYPPMRTRRRAISRRRIATVPGLEGPWPGRGEEPAGADWGTTVFRAESDIPVVVVRVNTVSKRMLEETMASGAVTDHPPGGASAEEVLEDLAEQFAPWRDHRAVRIVVLHHPPHPFDATLKTRLTTGAFEDRERFAQLLSALRVQLVIAGHRHELNPRLGAEWVASSSTQAPLLPPTVQLVGESPTQERLPKSKGRQPRSFCRYRLWTGGDSFAVERTLFRQGDGRGGFSARRSGTLFDGIPLV